MTVNLTNGWFADRSPGLGKQLIVNPGTTVGLSGVVITGQPSSGGGSTNPPASYAPLPPAGSVIPPIGNPSRSPYFLAFREAVGFDGSTSLYGLPLPANASSFSLSAWVNFGDLGVPFASNSQQGALLATPFDLTYNTGVGNVLFVQAGEGALDFTGPQFQGTSSNANNFWDVFSSSNTSIDVGANFSYPGNGTTNAGWVHLMMAIRIVGASKLQAVIRINDAVLYNSLLTLDALGVGAQYNPTFASSKAQFTNGGGNIEEVCIGGNSTTANFINGWFASRPSGGQGLKGGLTEFWAKWGTYIDWSNDTNAYKFQITDSVGSLQTWAPCDLGTNGSAPGFGVPTVYLSGGSSLFPANRAGGTRLSVYTATTGLFDVDDPPS